MIEILKRFMFYFLSSLHISSAYSGSSIFFFLLSFEISRLQLLPIASFSFSLLSFPYFLHLFILLPLQLFFSIAFFSSPLLFFPFVSQFSCTFRTSTSSSSFPFFYISFSLLMLLLLHLFVFTSLPSSFILFHA